MIRAHIIKNGVVDNTINVLSLGPDQIDADIHGGGRGWLWDGDTLSPPAPQPEVPAAITMRQARLVLLSYGLLDDVEAAINSIEDAPTRNAVRIEWDYSNELQRSNHFLAMLAPLLGLTDAQIDQMFIAGADI